METQQIDPKQAIFIQSRVAMNEEVIGEYFTLMKEGVQFEPAAGILDEATDQVYVWDGSHRGEAARRLGELLAVNLRPGTREEAEWLALTANQKHGLQRNRADKQQAIRQALRHPRGVGLSNSEIARHCGVDHKTVGRIRAELEAAGEIPRITERLVTRNGVTYRQETANLGQQQLGGQSCEGSCPRCDGAVHYDREAGELLCMQCTTRWPNTRAFADETKLLDIEEICRVTLDTRDPRWNHARQRGLSDQQLRDMIAHRWGRGKGQANPAGRGYWVAGYPKPALWIGRVSEREEIPTLDGAELLATVRAALQLPHGPETRYCQQCGTKAQLLASNADAAAPPPCSECGANEAGLWRHNPPAANGAQSQRARHSYILEEDQPQPCPECGEQRVRGVNGSQRWCIGCGASWPTAAAFLADVAAAGANGAATARQAEALTRRFAALARRLSPAQLNEIEAVIARLERQSDQLPMAGGRMPVAAVN
ncbi:MAG: hypothetical protein Kow0031_01120 [Anaerolineae bacterium]